MAPPRLHRLPRRQVAAEDVRQRMAVGEIEIAQAGDADDYLKKPFNLNDIIAVVKKYTEK